MYLNPTDPSEVKNIISNLKTKGNSGIDEIPSTVLKRTPDNVILALTPEVGAQIKNFNAQAQIVQPKFLIGKT